MARPVSRDMEIEDQIREAVWSVARSSFTSLRGHLQRAHLSPPQYWVLQMLESAGTLTTGQISENLGVRLPTVTGVLDLLAKQGLVTRLASASDRRRVNVRLTPRGVSQVRVIRARLHARWRENLQALGRSRKAEILDALTELETRIEREPVRRAFCRPPIDPAAAAPRTRTARGYAA